MQFHVNGYTIGDPSIKEPYPSVSSRPTGLPNDVDVLIIGCGPAGLVLAAQMANFPEITTLVIDRKDGPLKVGQADGVACRTVEMFEAFGLAERLVNEAYWVNEVCFWRPDSQDTDRIARAGRVTDTEEGLSEFPHVIVNQARLLAYLREHMERSPSRLKPFYGLEATDVEVSTNALSKYPVAVTVRHLENLQDTGETSVIRAKYAVGCEGARSLTRTAIGRALTGDETDEAWGVMDVLAVTDFPDIRIKCAITSAEGSMLIIPREGGYLVRLYIELDRVRDRTILESASVTPEILAEVANRILHPYHIEVKDLAWWSVYKVGQRLCDKFDDVPADEMATRLPRVFIAGDACHTHSAKAGQGMNVSMADAWNLGWKLSAVLMGTARPELLHTYSDERQAVARELIDFDHEFSALFQSRPTGSVGREEETADPDGLQRYFVEQGRFTAGVATAYAPSMITAHTTFQHLARGFPVGMRFHSAPVLRLADAKPMHLGHVAHADGAWRLYIYADQNDPTDRDAPMRDLCDFLQSDASPLKRFTPAGTEPDSIIDVRAVFQQGHRDLRLDAMPAILLPRKGKFGLIDYEKMFCPDPHAGDIFDLRRVNRATGCIVIVRPDQYVSQLLPLDAHDALTEFFAGVLIDAGSNTSASACSDPDGFTRPAVSDPQATRMSEMSESKTNGEGPAERPVFPPPIRPPEPISEMTDDERDQLAQELADRTRAWLEQTPEEE